MLPAPFTSDFLNRLEALRLRTRKEVLGGRQGSYASPRRGMSLEFADYRRYSPGDDIRYLDWGIFARTDRFYIRLFREEVDLFVYLFIDASGSMAFPSTQEKFSSAGHIALALAYVVLANHDHVKLHFLQESSAVTASPFYRGRNRIVDCIGFFSHISPDGPLEFAHSMGEHLRGIRRPGKAVILSDFLMPAPSYQQGLNMLRAFNLDISVIQVLGRQEIDPPFSDQSLALVDSESRAEIRLQWNRNLRKRYQEKLKRHNLELRSVCHQAGIHYSLFVTDQALSDFVLETLPAIGLFK
jgi:uncharacterized protein (DUF58 family)